MANFPQNEDFSALALDEADRIEAETNDSEQASYDGVSEFFDLENELIYDPIEASRQPGLTLEESTEVMGGLASRHRLKLAEKQNAETNLVITETAILSEKARFNVAKRDVLTQSTANEGKRLLQTVEQGKLIDQKTIGYALQGVSQRLLNAREFDVIQLETEKTDAIIASTIADIESIKSGTETKLLNARDAALKAAGVDTVDVPGY